MPSVIHEKGPLHDGWNDLHLPYRATRCVNFNFAD